MSQVQIKADEYFDEASELLSKAKTEIEKTIIGQSDVIEKTLITLACGGHALLVGVPGLAKTLLIETIGVVSGLSNARVQCTPDLMPSDILGSEILDQSETGQRSFRFVKGPVFTQILMADEINRASPRTQSALLQAMQEKTVSASGQTYKLPEPFHVLATQNPIEQEGTYPLPEAQLDRFLMQIDIHYPDEKFEREIIIKSTSTKQLARHKILNAVDLMKIQNLVQEMPISESVINAILKLVRNARPSDKAPDFINEYINWAPGPRAAQALMLLCRARALIQCRSAPSTDDVFALTFPVFQHRMSLNYKAHADGMNKMCIIDKLIETLQD